jgi:hypothetical protein
MNAKTTIVAAALALIAGAAGAADLVQIPTERGALTSAEVQAELARARAAGELTASGDSYGLQWAAAPRRAVPAQLARPKEDVRNEARSAARRSAVNSDYVGG